MKVVFAVFAKRRLENWISWKIVKKRKGMSELLIIKCRNCSNETRSFTSSRASSNTPFDINIRSTYASLPFGREGLAKFCGIMDLPAPVLNTSYTKVLKTLQEKSYIAAETEMKEAADRTINNSFVMTPDLVDVEPDGTQVARVAVTLDGTWQKRGHSSEYGVVF